MWDWNFDLSIGIGWIFLIFGGMFGLWLALNVWLMRSIKKIRQSGSADDKKMNIAVLSINGLLAYGAKPRSNFQKIMSQIGSIAERQPKALIVRVNSPGGTMSGSHEIYEALKKLKKSGMKMVVLMEDIAASGGVYISMAADKIVASPGTITGSIGVIIPHMNMSELLEKVGVKSDSVKSGEHKDMLSSSKPLSHDSRKLLQETIDDCLDQFVEVVAESRKMSEEAVRAFADGRIFNGRQALKLGLVDEVGGYETALKVAKELSEIKEGEERVQEVNPPMNMLERFGLLAQISSAVERADNILTGIELDGTPLYLMKK